MVSLKEALWTYLLTDSKDAVNKAFLYGESEAFGLLRELICLWFFILWLSLSLGRFWRVMRANFHQVHLFNGLFGHHIKIALYFWCYLSLIWRSICILPLELFLLQSLQSLWAFQVPKHLKRVQQWVVFLWVIGNTAWLWIIFLDCRARLLLNLFLLCGFWRFCKYLRV